MRNITFKNCQIYFEPYCTENSTYLHICLFVFILSFNLHFTQLQLEELERMREEIAVPERTNQDIMSDDEEEYDFVEALGSNS